jgi:hypothetical protein
MSSRSGCLVALLITVLAAGCAGGGESSLETSARAYFDPDHPGRVVTVLEGPVEDVECRQAEWPRRERAQLDDPKAVRFGCRVTFRDGGTQAWRFRQDRFGATARRCPEEPEWLGRAVPMAAAISRDPLCAALADK